MSQPNVYLAGPITGLTFQGCTDWREYAKQELAKAGIKGWSPMRAKDYLAHLQAISGHGDDYAHLGVLSTSRAVITRDRWDCTRCDMILVNLLGAQGVSIGTVMEMAWADLARVPIICAIEPEGNVHEHMMVREAIGFRVATLDEAIHVAKAALT